MISRLGKLQTTRNLVWSKFHPIRYSDIKDESIDILLLFMDRNGFMYTIIKRKADEYLLLVQMYQKQNQLFIHRSRMI